jgi:predicted nucleic acid-binding protein
MRVLVSDTSVLIDLERADLLDVAFSLPHTLVVPDLLYEQELRNYDGPRLIRLGLAVEELDGACIRLALDYQRRQRVLSAPDSFAIALARQKRLCLLTGDGPLRALAAEDQMECHGVLWVFDQMHEAALLPADVLCAGVERLVGHTRCRLPHAEVRTRLRRYRGE